MPHDATVDDYYQKLPKDGTSTPQPQALSVPLAGSTAGFTPTGAHTKHAGAECSACHPAQGGTLCFAGSASFDASAKTCSTVACHGAYSGTFTYARWDWGCECEEYVSVSYAGSGGNTASWYYSSGLPTDCAMCHGNPPANYAWHTANHGLPFVSTGRNCETCHPDAVSASVNGKIVGVSISTNATLAAMHSNGAINVQARFTSKCFSCH